MEKRILYCDRCGKQCEEKRNNRGFHLFRKEIYYRMQTSHSNEYLDLCQSCYDGLYDWMNKKGEK